MSISAIKEDELLAVRCIAKEVGLRIEFRVISGALWTEVSKNLTYLPVAYSDIFMDYQVAYSSQSSESTTDLSLIIFHGINPCAIWPIAVYRGISGLKVGSNNGDLLPPLFLSTLPKKSQKSLAKLCLKFLNRVLLEYQIDTWVGAEGVVHSALKGQGLSEWMGLLLTQGGYPILGCDLFVDLSLSIDSIKSHFRKSYKSLINSGSKNFKIVTCCDANPLSWNEFRSLHLEVSGRVTRSDESWNLQYKSIELGEAFLIALRDDTGRMVGGGFFNATVDEALYAVGVYDRRLFEHPLGHMVQYAAILEMKRRGIKWYKLGSMALPYLQSAPSEKEISISHFKEGFATHLFPNYRISF